MALALQTMMPGVVTPNSQKIVTDIDGDTVNEMVIFDSTLQQLSIVHQFKYTDFTLEGIDPTLWPGETSSIWTSDTGPHWWTSWSAKEGLVPPSQGSTGWQLEWNDVIIAADLDGDNVDELFIYNLSTLWWGVLKWNSQANELQMLSKIDEATPPVVLGMNGWVAAAGDQYFIVPNLGSIIPSLVTTNPVGILAYNPQTPKLGLISHSPSEGVFVQWWSSESLSPGWNLKASIPATNVFYPGNFADPVKPSIVVFDPIDNYIALLTWGESGFSTAGSAQTMAGQWHFDQADQLQCADLDGDGITEILIYNPKHKFLGVLKWDNTQFGSLEVTQQIGTAPSDWTVTGKDNYYCLNGSGDNPGQIYAFSSSEPLQIAMMIFQNNLIWKWASATLSPNNGWPVTANDDFYIGAPSNSVTPTLFTVSTQGPALSSVPMLGAISWTGASLQIDSHAKLPVLAWSPAFLASAPDTPFPEFTKGDQPAIYTYISQTWPNPELGKLSRLTDVRKMYHKAAKEGFFTTFAAIIAAVASPSQIPSTWPKPPANNWSDHDWRKVVHKIAEECTHVYGVYGLYTQIDGLGSNINTFQTADLGIANANITAAAQNEDTSAVEYWLGQFFVAAVWGLAAAGGLFLAESADAAIWGVIFSIVASGAGSGASYNPTEEKSYAFDEVGNEIIEAFANSIVTHSVDRHAFLKDSIKLRICYELSQSSWQVASTVTTQVQDQFRVVDRRSMYQQLMPFYFSIAIVNPLTYLPPPSEAPPVLFTLGDNKYSLKAEDYVSVADFNSPNVALYVDLFTTLGVSQEDFFVGNGGWGAIKRTVL